MHLEHDVMTVREVAGVLRVSEATVRSEIGRGKLGARLVGRAYRVEAEVLQRYMEAGVQPVGRHRGHELGEDAEATEGR